MLEVKNLVKIYKTSKKDEVRALDDVSINFPEHGLVFLLGKSGSGKSTLLNTIGGLDKFDSGEIIVKGKSSKNFSQSDFDSYRNTFIGFIFQEYNVLEEFTVAKNIALALELQGKKATKETVEDLLKQVEMEKFAKRKPNQLSGGQKQRIAIARALIKNPEIIMADEPTGALDSKTGEQVMQTLKNLSHDKLVIIVSHDQDFAERYGDRIIELKDGKVISDITKKEVAPQKTKSGISIIDNKIVHIKKGQEITKSDLDAICKSIINHSKNGDTIISLDEKANEDIKKSQSITDDGNREVFKPTEENDIKLKSYDAKNFKLIKSHLRFKDSFKMGASALKSKVGKLIFTIFLSFIAFAIFGVINTFSTFNRPNSVYETVKLQKEDKIALRKQTFFNDNGDEDNIFETFTPEEIATLEKNFPEITFDKIVDSYKVYRYSNSSDTLEISSLKSPQSYSSIYTNNISGFTDINEEKLTSLGFKLVAGSLPSADNEICITINMYEGFEKNNSSINSYSDFLNYCSTHNANLTKKSGLKIVGIIDPKIDVSEYKKESDGVGISDYVKQETIMTIVTSGYINMIFGTENTKAEIQSNITGKTYEISADDNNGSYPTDINSSNTLNAMYKTYKTNHPSYTNIKESFVTNCFKHISSKYSSIFNGDEVIELNDNEIMCRDYYFQNITGELYDMVDAGTLKISMRQNGRIIKEFTVVAITSDTSNSRICLSNNFINTTINAEKNNYDYIIGQLSTSDAVNKKFVKFCETLNANNTKYTIQNASTSILDEFGSTISQLAKIFLYIGIGFAVFASLLLMSFISTSINYKRREIGILRALGARGADAFGIFFNESLIIALINFVLASIATVVVCSIINWSIINKLGIKITLLVVGPLQIAVILGVSLLSAFLASLIPVMKIARKKPIDAINNR